MRIISITFNQFKSFLKPQKIEFDNNLVCVIGLNGSGKSNLLDAIFQILQPMHRNEQPIEFTMDIVIDDYDIERYRDFIEIDDKNRRITAYSSISDQPRLRVIDRVIAPHIVKSLKLQQEELISLYQELSKVLEVFLKRLESVFEDNTIPTTIGIKISNERRLIMPHEFESIIQRPMKAIQERLEKIIVSSNGDLVIEEHFPFVNASISYLQFFELEYNPIKLSSFDHQYIQVKENEIIKQINDINKDLVKYREAIIGSINKLTPKLEFIASLIEKQYQHEIVDTDYFRSIYSEIMKITNPGIFYLANESGYSQYYNLQGISLRPSLRTSEENILLKNFIQLFIPEFNKSYGTNVAKSDDLTIEQKRSLIRQIEDYFKSHLPIFEKDKILGITLDENFRFYIKELFGEIVPLSKINSGRRWYLTYLITKEFMKPGDILLLDEPASGLHPLAQLEFKKDIEQFSRDHTIIMTTHSPYMISEHSTVYQASISTEGSTIQKYSDPSLVKLVSKYHPDLYSTFSENLIHKLLPLDEIAKKITAKLKTLDIPKDDIAKALQIDDPSNLRKKLVGKNFTFYDLTLLLNTFSIDPFEVMFG